jgi:hypothetical protein
VWCVSTGSSSLIIHLSSASESPDGTGILCAVSRLVVVRLQQASCFTGGEAQCLRYMPGWISNGGCRRSLSGRQGPGACCVWQFGRCQHSRIQAPVYQVGFH